MKPCSVSSYFFDATIYSSSKSGPILMFVSLSKINNVDIYREITGSHT